VSERRPLDLAIVASYSADGGPLTVDLVLNALALPSDQRLLASDQRIFGRFTCSQSHFLDLIRTYVVSQVIEIHKFFESRKP